jgi:photosystem II stability/assembly factor-like uncharacterized protein
MRLERRTADGGDEDHPLERSRWNASFRTDASGRLLSQNRLKALSDAGRLERDLSMRTPGTGLRSLEAPALSWQSIGPQPIQSKKDTDRNWGNVSGRVDALAIHPTNPSVLLLGSATGGIWKSTDAGSTWRPVSDNAPSLATTSIAFAPSNPSIVFATTGELDKSHAEGTPSTSFGTYLGAGLLKSLDGGETWFRVDADLPSNALFSRVIVDPRTPQTVVVGINYYLNVSGDSTFIGGIYRSTNGGVNFTRVFSHLVIDLAQDPNDPSRLYLTASDTDCSACPPGGVYVSSNSGLAWTEVLGSADEYLDNSRLGVSRTNPTAVYVSLVNDGNAHGTETGIFVSSDAGNNWQKRSVDPTMCAAASNQCGYDHWIVPHPTNPNVVYFGSIDIYKSVDGAQTWQRVTTQYQDGRAEPVHPDQHACLIVPSSPNTIYFGNDGGVYKTTDGGQSFQNLNSTLSLSQFNGIALHPSNPSFAIGGTQDNGNPKFTGSPVWTDMTSGDGCFYRIRWDNPSEILSAHYYAYLQYSSDGGASFTSVTPCGTLMDCDNETYLDPMGFYPPATTAPSAPGTVLLGTNRIWANNTFGRDPAAWVPRSSGKITNSHFTAIAAAGNGSGAVWGGTITGSVFFSSDGGATFASRFNGLPSAIVTSIVPYTADGRSAYITFGGFLGASSHIFYTTNAGQTWTNLSSNLPDIPVLSLAINPADENDLFVGTDIGVFRNPSGSSDWFTFNQGMPIVPIYGLTFSQANGNLYAATYGRGIFRIGLGGSTPCVAGANTLCLNGGRFRVTAFFQSPGASGAATAVALTGDTGYFWFFSAGNVEIVLKVVDGRSFNSRFWVFAGGLTNVGVVITVTDTQSGAIQTYVNPQGVAFQPIQDTNAFAAATAPGGGGSAARSLARPSEVIAAAGRTRLPEVSPAALAAPCVANATTLCLNNGRFSVRTLWTAPGSGSGAGQAVALTGDTGYFWFFSPSNAEIVAKVVTGCGFNSRYWVFAGGLTNVNVVTTVTDTQTGAIRTYVNNQGVPFQPVQDTNAFFCP